MSNSNSNYSVSLNGREYGIYPLVAVPRAGEELGGWLSSHIIEADLSRFNAEQTDAHYHTVDNVVHFQSAQGAGIMLQIKPFAPNQE